jgi:4-amino-4-deoxy-L-arabinose transferase-like glycosyltransferase
LVAVVLLGVTIRALVIVLTPGALVTDPDGYRRLAEQVRFDGTLGHGDLPSAFRPPLYPLLLAPLVGLGPTSPAAIAVLHLALAAATIAMVVCWGNALGLGRASYIAALLVACDPLLIWQSTLVMTETLAAMLAAAAGLSLARAATCNNRGAWATAGATLALAALCRPVFLVWLAAVVAALLLWAWRGKMPVGAAVAVTLAAGVVLSPWALRNWRIFGRPIVATTHGGYTMLLANNPEYYESLRKGGWRHVWLPQGFAATQAKLTPVQTPADELVRDRENYRAACAAIRREPGMFVVASLVRLGNLWVLVPHQLDGHEPPWRWGARVWVGVWYLFVFVLAALGWRRARAPRDDDTSCSPPDRQRHWGWRLGWLLVVALSAVHLVYWTNFRMRAPALPLIALTAAAAVSHSKRCVKEELTSR